MDTVTGNELALPLVVEVGATRSHVARSVTWHAHAGHQLLFLLRGTTAYEFRGRDRTEMELPGGHFLVIPPNVGHRGAPDMRPPCILFHLVLAAGPDTDCRHASFTPEEWRWLRRQLQRARLSVHPFSTELQRLAAQLVRAVPEFRSRAGGPLQLARLRGWVCEILLESAAQLNTATKAEPDDVVQAAEAHLRNRLDEKVRMSEVARALGVTRARLFEQFKRGTGMTPNDFLQRVRVEKARELMANRRKSVTEVAFAVGFSSSQYFSTVFRRYTGQTPGEYRQSLERGTG